MSIKNLLGSRSPYYEMMRSASHCRDVDEKFLGQLKKQIKEQVDLFLPCTEFIYDYKNQHYPYISDNIEWLTGFGAQQYTLQGKELHLSRLHPSDLPLYTGKAVKMMRKKILNPKGHAQPGLYFWINYRYQRADGHYIHLLQKHRVICSSVTGVPLLIVGTLLDISHIKFNKIIFRMASALDKKHDTAYHFKQAQKSILTLREQEVTQLSLKGKNNREIAKLLHIDYGTVKNHKHNIFEKTGAKSINEAARKAGVI